MPHTSWPEALVFVAIVAANVAMVWIFMGGKR